MPELESNIDTKYFDNYEEEDPWWLPENEIERKFNFGKDNYENFLFFDFTLKRDID